MNYLILIIIGIAGIWIGRSLALRNTQDKVPEQTKQKQQNKEKILEFLHANEKVRNNDVEKLLGVSDSTATRYLDELEQEGKIRQIGATGKGVFYVLK